ncbi:3-deoxy-D-manno-octulosonic acid transferase [Lewinellaceae bacterium SD302]|nr:3-deoxy-D-manno-octulosonic acid transferase [Lewinellaceae bacterium SD302]
MLPQLGSQAYHLGVRLAASFGVAKARKWVQGRDAISDKLDEITRSRQADQKLIWLHAASLGEFEQGAPVLKRIRNEYPEHFLVVSFFSPSGYEARKDYPDVDAVLYLAEDNTKDAKSWVARLNPQLAIFVKYEFWPAHLNALLQAAIPTVLIAGSFRPEQPFFHWYGGAWRKMLAGFDKIMVQTEADAELLRGIDLPGPQITVAGDPRIDRTIQLANDLFEDDILANFSQDYRCLLAGSVWPPDVAILLDLLAELPEDWRLIVAPHDLKEDQIQTWTDEFGAIRYTSLQNGSAQSGRHKVLMLDTIGILSRAYRYADLAYVGGGFKTGLHNTLEPMAYNLPVIFGPHYHKFPEAVATVSNGGSFSVENEQELKDIFKFLQADQNYKTAVSAIRVYKNGAMDATERTFKSLQPYLQVTQD